MKGYKVFDPDFTCRGFQFEVGKTFEMDGLPVMCQQGFHFCIQAADCFNYYSFSPNNQVAEVEALGDIVAHESDSKVATNKIHIIRELSWFEVLEIVNTGKNNTGFRNAGDCNTGDWNTGNCNTGNCNTGNRNTGDCNTGDCNTGLRNTGNCNTGLRNTGNCNTGNRNTGNCNTGSCNTGDFNLCNFSSGVFCTIEPKALFFDQPSEMTLVEWRNSEAYDILLNLKPTKWISTNNMTEEEKQAHPEYETTDGYLKQFSYQEAWRNLWGTLDYKQREIIKNIPNFDPEKFKQITGIEVV